jgi:flagellum-specific peptidoglycan hydrolase FlgJ|tara:strand:- start:323 stop:970 length:648 start_codon:yes stop_codon:yes gene_type:complete
MRIFSTILLLIASVFIYTAIAKEQPCTDDGCPEFNNLTVEKISYVEKETEIEDFPNTLPVINTETKSQFVYSLNKCIDKIYENTPTEYHIPKELIIAQAAIETGWGKSRFANEGNNLFGIRTWNKDEEWLLPITWDQDKWIGWGVKVYDTRCDSVKDYIRIINEVFAYEAFREARSKGADVYQLADTLTKYASKKNYTDIIKSVIKNNIRGVYDL